jgi:hypothetical protein
MDEEFWSETVNVRHYSEAPYVPKRERNTKACLEDGVSNFGFILLMTGSAVGIF